MTTKRFSTLSLLFCICINMFPCASEVIHNYYMFSAYNKDIDEDKDNLLVTFWKEYLGVSENDSRYFNPAYKMDEVIETATRKQDEEMKSYATLLKSYLDICEKMSESWNYPTRQQLEQRTAQLNNIASTSKAYKGTRLRSRHALLHMRANMLLKRYDVNKNYWTTYASKLIDSPLKNMMEGIHANALLNTGEKKAACEIYAKLGDMQSLAWSVRKYRNLAGIKSVYGENPNSHTLPYLVEDFVNTYQDVVDNRSYGEGDLKVSNPDEADKSKTDIGKDAREFIAFANSVLKEGKTNSPVLWKTAIGVLQFHLGSPRQAERTLESAMNMNGTERMRDVARAARMIAQSYNVQPNEKFEKNIVKELQWLDTKCHNGHKTEYANGIVKYSNFFTRMKDRLFFLCLMPSYEHAGNTKTALALLDNYCNHSLQASNQFNYSDDFISKLRTMPAKEVESYYQFLHNGGETPLEMYLFNGLRMNHDFYADMIGTCYLDEADFDKAESWLEKVNSTFISRLGVAPWFGARDYTIEPWFCYQQCTDYVNKRYGKLLTFAENPRLSFCKDMQKLISQYQKATGKQHHQIAYTLATRAFQASYLGQCWWLTAYGQSAGDTVRLNHKDIFHQSYEWLKEASETSDATLKGKVLAALSFMPIDDWANSNFVYDKINKQYITKYTLIPQSIRYKNIKAFNDYVKKNQNTEIAKYASRCDVILSFRKQTGDK